MLNYFAISGISLNWFKSYLTDREQECLVDGHLSSPRKMKCGVPQGSILGPLLFLMYINDMPDCLKYPIPSLYADDTEILIIYHLKIAMILLSPSQRREAPLGEGY